MLACRCTTCHQNKHDHNPNALAPRADGGPTPSSVEAEKAFKLAQTGKEIIEREEKRRSSRYVVVAAHVNLSR